VLLLQLEASRSGEVDIDGVLAAGRRVNADEADQSGGGFARTQR